eukprot:TRINITY_DN7272_c0_g1_i1.p1 TRINITY_DN7272_c0_g1~~TRINITY_DN7272_c0_g1_i1.p1  ORF type:complete len:179 (-),score=18.43 TRINITY_DN7272_c0_g1_i1:183-719(-)
MQNRNRIRTSLSPFWRISNMQKMLATSAVEAPYLIPIQVSGISSQTNSSGLFIDGIGFIPMPLTEPYAQNLMLRFQQASFDLNEKTLFDLFNTLGESCQLDTTQFSFKNPLWNSIMASAVNEVRQRMEIKSAFERHAHKLLINKAGSKSYKFSDTKKAPGAFGTLIVELPSAHVVSSW